MTLLLSFFLLTIALASSTKTGPVGPVKLYDVKVCSGHKNPFKFNPKLKTDKDKSVALEATLTVPKELGDNLFLTITAEEFVNNKWQPVAFSAKNEPFFTLINSYIPKIWDSLRKKITPPIKDFKKIPAGDYKLSMFKVSYQDISTPQVPYGRFKATYIVKVDKEEAVCGTADIEFFRPGIPKK